MKRRAVFKHLAVASAAVWLLPACVADPKKVSLVLNRLEITPEEEAMLGDLAAVMIPSSQTSSTPEPGAREVNAHLFALIMVDDCLTKSQQEQYLKGMRHFNAAVKSLTGKSFLDPNADDGLAILTSFEKNIGDADEDVRMFYSRTRGYIIQGYTSSKYFLTEVKPYQLVPGPNYEGCAPISAEQKLTL